MNPVIAEAVIQTAAQVVGNDTTITIGGQGGVFELNVMLPVMAYNLLQSIQLLGNAARVFATRCINGISADRKICEQNVEQSLALVTALAPHVGYDRAADIAKTAYESGEKPFGKLRLSRGFCQRIESMKYLTNRPRYRRFVTHIR